MEQWKKTEMPTGHTFSRPTGACGQAESIVFFVAVGRGQWYVIDGAVETEMTSSVGILYALLHCYIVDHFTTEWCRLGYTECTNVSDLSYFFCHVSSFDPMSVGVDCGENRRSGVNNGVQRGAVAPPRTHQARGAKYLRQNISWLTSKKWVWYNLINESKVSYRNKLLLFW